MKKTAWLTACIVIISAIVIWRSDIHDFITRTPEFASLHEEPVILYGTSWCPYCEQTKAFLESNKIPYFEYNIESSSEGFRQYKQLHGAGTPLLLVNDQVIRGFNQPEIRKALSLKTSAGRG